MVYARLQEWVIVTALWLRGSVGVRSRSGFCGQWSAHGFLGYTGKFGIQAE